MRRIPVSFLILNLLFFVPLSYGWSDTFSGTSLDASRWQVVTSANAMGNGYFTSTPASRNIVVVDGLAKLPINAGDTYQSDNDYSNVVLTDASAGWQAITVKIKGGAAFDDPYRWNQFDVLLWNDEDNHVKFGFNTNDINPSNSGELAGHVTVGYGIETNQVRWHNEGSVDDRLNLTNDVTLRVQKNTDGTYKFSYAVGTGPMQIASAAVAFATEAGVGQTPAKIGFYAGAGGATDTTNWWPYDPTSNRSVDVLVDSFTVSGPGDANYDGKVDVSDLGILAANYGGSGKTWELGDFSGDGKVDVSDLGILAANYGTSGGNVPEPVSLALLGLGSLLLRKKA